MNPHKHIEETQRTAGNDGATISPSDPRDHGPSDPADGDGFGELPDTRYAW